MSAFEEAPVSEKYRRRFAVNGLENATVYYFPEKYAEKHLAVTTTQLGDITPVLDEDWVQIYDPVFGFGFKGEGKNGKLAFLMPFEKYL